VETTIRENCSTGKLAFYEMLHYISFVLQDAPHHSQSHYVPINIEDDEMSYVSSCMSSHSSFNSHDYQESLLNKSPFPPPYSPVLYSDVHSDIDMSPSSSSVIDEGCEISIASKSSTPPPLIPSTQELVNFNIRGDNIDKDLIPSTQEVVDFKIGGDNIDKDVKPRFMRIDRQTRSLHYFNVIAVRDRIDCSHLPDTEQKPMELPLNAFFPCSTDYVFEKSL
jgi:hypothetical protein